MTRVRRLLVGCLVLVLSASLLSGCKKTNQVKDKVLRFIDATIPLARQFTYADADANKNLTVVGIVEDAFRYKARLSVNGTASWDEVVSDDAVADRFLDASLLPAIVTKSLALDGPTQLASLAAQLAAAPPPVSAGGSISAIDALRTGRWLLDPAGAPSPVASAADEALPGNDPIHDAVTVLDYVRAAVQEAPFVKKYDAESLEPVYKPTEDPFPKPGPGVDRYDLKEVPLPTSQANGGIRAPQVANFRKMAVYVQGGHIIEVRERIDVLSKVAIYARNYHVSVPGGSRASAGEQVAFVTAQYDKQVVPAGGQPLRPRDMTVQFLDLGTPQTVAMPTDDVVSGDASVLPLRGKAGATNGAGGGGNAFTGNGAGAGGASVPADSTTVPADSTTAPPDSTTAPPGG